MAKQPISDPLAGPQAEGPSTAGAPEASGLKRRHWRVWVASHLAVFGLGIITTLAVAAAVYPWVTISELRITSPADPFALRFLLKNEGFWSLRNIRVRCSVFSVASHGRSQIVESAFEDQTDLGHSLKPRHQTHLDCTPEVADADTIKRAALSVSVSFERFYLPWAWRREEPPFVYSLERGKDRRAVWLPQG
jgi:hypothetical protein